MSKNCDKLSQIRLDPDNRIGLLRIKKKDVSRRSLNQIANAFIRTQLLTHSMVETEMQNNQSTYAKKTD